MMVRFLVIHRLDGTHTWMHEYRDDEPWEQAWHAALEFHQADRDVEVVLLSACDRVTIERTHSKYFR